MFSQSLLMIRCFSLPMITNKFLIHPLPIIALVISSPLVASVLPIIKLSMALENLPMAANGLPLVPIHNDIWGVHNIAQSV